MTFRINPYDDLKHASTEDLLYEYERLRRLITDELTIKQEAEGILNDYDEIFLELTKREDL
jgi:hypothetical protein